MNMKGVKTGDVFELKQNSENGERVIFLAVKKMEHEWEFITFWVVCTSVGNTHSNLGENLFLSEDDVYKIAIKIKNVLS